jgi:deoxyribodipyrimidine photolyase-related protein
MVHVGHRSGWPKVTPLRRLRVRPEEAVGRRRLPVHRRLLGLGYRHREPLAANIRTSRAVTSMNRLADLDAVLEQEMARERF